MKERPILFSGMMVRAILEGRKTMTRRVNGLDAVNREPDAWTVVANKGGGAWLFRRVDSCTFKKVLCPYGVPGDRLWVREAHYAFGRWTRDGFTKKGDQRWRFVRVEEMPVRFEEPQDGFRTSRDRAQLGKEQWYMRLARFMPRAYARIALEVTGVRVERLIEISEADARAEGATWPRYEDFEPVTVDGITSGPARIAFKELWSNINGAASLKELWSNINGAASWYRNPWVWVVEFRVVATT